MYLWRAHNNVNNRLHNDVTEDPQFTKYQFPPVFLCPACQDENRQLKTDKVKEFLLQYYRDIRPVNEKKKA
jgi:thiol oxidase